METIIKYAEYLVKLEFMKARYEVFVNDSGSRGVDFIIKAKSGKYHEVSLQALNLEKDRSIKIPKSIWNGEMRENRWIALVLFMKEMEPVVYLIPSKVWENPNQIFIDNDQGERFSHLSNWEIHVFTKAIQELSQYAFVEKVKELV